MTRRLVKQLMVIKRIVRRTDARTFREGEYIIEVVFANGCVRCNGIVFDLFVGHKLAITTDDIVAGQ